LFNVDDKGSNKGSRVFHGGGGSGIGDVGTSSSQH